MTPKSLWSNFISFKKEIWQKAPPATQPNTPYGCRALSKRWHVHASLLALALSGGAGLSLPCPSCVCLQASPSPLSCTEAKNNGRWTRWAERGVQEAPPSPTGRRAVAAVFHIANPWFSARPEYVEDMRAEWSGFSLFWSHQAQHDSWTLRMWLRIFCAVAQNFNAF